VQRRYGTRDLFASFNVLVHGAIFLLQLRLFVFMSRLPWVNNALWIYATIKMTSEFKNVSMMVGVVDGLALHGGRGRRMLSCCDAERYRCACLHCTQGLAGRGDGYQCGLNWGRSSYKELWYVYIAAVESVHVTDLATIHCASLYFRFRCIYVVAFRCFLSLMPALVAE